MYLCDVYTIGVNLAGLPGISLPCGFSKSGLPIGLQLIGQPYREADLLAMAAAYEGAHDWHARHPDMEASIASWNAKAPGRAS
jgi:aspartyl-tRNA(Asn)/glutamyl-tRNA(Gln) amidotransferase subunit A